MGKITEALKKAAEERNLQKRAQAQEKVGPTLDATAQIQKDTAAQKEERSVPEERAYGRRKPSLEERLKDRLYIAKATDDSGIDPRIVTHFDPKAAISEQYRILRTNIQSNNPSRPLKTIVISSALHGEGKTITAVNLAITMARDLDKAVLLGDCDLRGGAIHQLLALNPAQGIADILVNGFAPEFAFCRTRINNLTVLPRGNIPHNPSELLGSKKMRRLLEELKPRFDYIILDSPPIIPLTDAGILGSQADGVILIVQAQRTQARIVERAQSLLKQAHAKILGFVLTHAEYYVPKYMYRYY